MSTLLLHRELTVDLGLQEARDHLGRIEKWPSWARHIKRIELQPPGELGRHSAGTIQLTNGMKPTFRMTEFQPLASWKWVGPFLWATVIYDYQFQALGPKQTRLIWTIEAEGFAASILGPLFASIYRRSLDKAIPRLVGEMNAVAP